MMNKKILLPLVVILLIVGIGGAFLLRKNVSDRNGGFIDQPRSTSLPQTKPSGAGSGCKVGGCSSQLCLDADSGGGVSTCEWREEYACYKSSRCELQENGHCGWTQTNELKSCLERSKGKNNDLMVPIQ